jgi:DNA repair photolyase
MRTVYIYSMHKADPPATLVYMPREALKGRGTAWAIEHRFTSEHHEAFDDGWGTLEQAAQEEQAAPQTQIIEQQVRTILAGNDSPDIAFDLSINPYRGCEHGCIYCFARPTHSYLNLSPGLDFETKIIAKVNAAERLRAALSSPRYEPKALNVGSATDCYQPVERRLRITRSVIEVLAESRHAFSIITKSSGIERDLDLLGPLARDGLHAAYVSLTTLDPALARIMEPRAASPQRRLKTIERLASAGVPVGVSVSPLIPFINEPELEHVIEQAAAAGATSAFAIVLRLPWEVSPLFQQWLQTHFPDRAARVMARMHDMRGGKDYDARFHERMKGQGVWGQLLAQRLEKVTRRLRLNEQRKPLDLSAFRRPAAQHDGQPQQQALF